MIAVRRGLGIGLPGVEQPPRDAEREGDVSPRTRLHDVVGEVGPPVADRIDHDDPRAFLLRRLQDGQHVHVADVGVLPPDQNRFRVDEIEQVVAVLDAEVGELRRVSRSGANVARLHGAGSEPREEPVVQVFHHAEGAAASVVQDRGAARLGLDAKHFLGDGVQGIVPGDLAEAPVPAHQRRGDAVGIVLALEEAARPVAEEAARDRMVGIPLDLEDAAVFHGGDDAAGVGTIAIAGGADPHGQILNAPVVSRRQQAAQYFSGFVSTSANDAVAASAQPGSRHSGRPRARPINVRASLTSRARCLAGSAFLL